MSYRSNVISKLLTEQESRKAYVRAKLNHIIPSQIRALRLDEPWTQKELGVESDMKQGRISAAETPGAVNFNLETLVRLASAFKVGLWVEFISYSEMIDRENRFSQDAFRPTRLPDDRLFLAPDQDDRIPDYDYSCMPEKEEDTTTDIGAYRAKQSEWHPNQLGSDREGELWKLLQS